MLIPSVLSLRAKLTSGLLPVAYLLTLLVAVTAGFYASHTQRPANTITLPLLVYPSDGASAHVESVVLMVDDPSGVDRLYVQAHQPFYHLGAPVAVNVHSYDPETAAEIRINGGKWISVDDEHVTCARPEESHGCVAGGYATIRFSVRARKVQAGPNLIEFKYNGTRGIRSGYRVLALGFMRGGDDLQSFNPFREGAHDPSLLRREDYSTWAPPEGYDTASDVAAGSALWREQGSLVENALTGKSIRAACSSCHATDGRDLKYFNYSNEVIAARARFHGLTETQGKQIAAYIRSLELRTDEGRSYEAPGTPWDPPYQPGPTALASREPGDPRTTGQAFAEMDEAFWAAGAGQEWVLEEDVEMLPYVFPETPISEDPTPTLDRLPSGELNWRQVSADSTLNMRLIPVSAQFPDWNNWLPDIHPIDSQPTEFSSITDELFDFVTAITPSGIVHKMEQFARGFRRSQLKNAPGSLDARERKMSAISNYQWQSVKVFEKIQFGGYTDVADDLYCDHPLKPFCEPLAWPGTRRFVFDIGPHISASPKPWNQKPYVYGTLRRDIYYTHLWYQLQTTINPGASPKSAKISPVDWEYQRNFINRVGGLGVRYFASMIKTIQVLSNGYGMDGGSNGSNPTPLGLRRGFLARTTTPDYFMRARYGGPYKNLPEVLREDLWIAGVRAWWDFNDRFDASEFARGIIGRAYKPSSYVVDINAPIRRSNTENNIYRGLYESAKWLGPRAYPLIDSIAAWGAKMWPKTRGPAWDELVPDDYADAGKAPDVRITNLSDGDAFSVPVDLTVEVDAHVSKGTIKKVELLTDGKKRAEKTKPPYRFTWRDVPPGRHTIAVRAQSNKGLRTTTTPITVTVNKNPTGPEQVVQRISLEKGWNLISSRLRPRNSDIEAVLADLLPHIVLVKDESGATFVPKYQINTIGRWEPHEAYMIYMRSDATLEIRGRPLAPTAAIPLEAGWNFVPYWPEVPLPIEDAFAAILSDFAIVKDAAGRAYLPGWRNEIDRLKPGQGYKIFVMKDIQFTYPKGSYASTRQHPPPSLAAGNKQ